MSFYEIKMYFLCWDVAAGWILNTDYCSPTFGWSKVRELDSQGISESAVLSRLRTCVQKTRRSRKWHLVIRWRNRAWPCFVLSVGFLFVTTSEMVRFLSRFREWRWRCEPVRRRIALRSNCSQRPAAGFLSSAVLIYCPSPQRRSCKQLLQENFLREVGKPVFRISKHGPVSTTESSFSASVDLKTSQ